MQYCSTAQIPQPTPIVNGVPRYGDCRPFKFCTWEFFERSATSVSANNDQNQPLIPPELFLGSIFIIILHFQFSNWNTTGQNDVFFTKRSQAVMIALPTPPHVYVHVMMLCMYCTATALHCTAVRYTGTCTRRSMIVLLLRSLL